MRLDTEVIHASRDWGYAPDFVGAMISAMRTGNADDYIVATGRLTPIEKILDAAFSCAELGSWSKWVNVSEPDRPTDHPGSAGDSSKLAQATGWRPTLEIEETVQEMVHHQLQKMDGLVTDEQWLDMVMSR